jgi:hypothetical protein
MSKRITSKSKSKKITMIKKKWIEKLFLFFLNGEKPLSKGESGLSFLLSLVDK